jgi:hypothetical protein
MPSPRSLFSFLLLGQRDESEELIFTIPKHTILDLPPPPPTLANDKFLISEASINLRLRCQNRSRSWCPKDLSRSHYCNARRTNSRADGNRAWCNKIIRQVEIYVYERGGFPATGVYICRDRSAVGAQEPHRTGVVIY